MEKKNGKHLTLTSLSFPPCLLTELGSSASGGGPVKEVLWSTRTACPSPCDMGNLLSVHWLSLAITSDVPHTAASWFLPAVCKLQLFLSCAIWTFNFCTHLLLLLLFKSTVSVKLHLESDRRGGIAKGGRYPKYEGCNVKFWNEIFLTTSSLGR